MIKKQRGFTIVELMIATTVFSVVMVICLAAFLRVGQLYYKGIYLARTQEVARNISDDIVNQLRLNGSPTLVRQDPATPSEYYFCAGYKRYTFLSNHQVSSQNESPSNFGLVRDDMPPGGCLAPTSSPISKSSTELLGDKMRVVATLSGSDISDTCATPTANLTCVHVHVDFGDDDLLVSPTSPNPSFTTALGGFVGGTCSGPLQGSQFCATTDLDTMVNPSQ